ncbi:phospholipase D family protein [Chlamydia pecorum IPTaLE]|uniref:phospholipase D-like domain-containing protein n=1 Tax=Chlamydia pecorum TaxID=85991 RepID=UPI0003D3ED44|nr:phospholipase D-like domain-containing protein [Chlamydia pecorum]ETF38016.1 phospholipase D family protein [Chlamydia pecorum DBDeUG]ETF40251.1 phospholipase D family protein [Chlamydia pecorum IPTaLE]UBV33216.1 phospholipase D family protein [Chlamydia pecorum]
MKKKQATLRIIFVVVTTVFLGVLAKTTKEETYNTFLKSEEPVIFSKQAHEDVRQVLCDAIDHADKEISLRIYNLQEPSIIASLSKQAENHLPLTIDYQMFKAREAFPKTSNVTLTEHPREGRKLMHQKALAIDKKYAWIGSANYTFDSLILDSNLIIGIKSSELCDHISANTSGSFVVNKQPLEYFVLPKDGSKALFSVLQILNKAEKTIRVGMFALTHPGILQALHDAMQRGVAVEVIIDKGFRTPLQGQLEKLQLKNFPFSIKTTPHKLHHKFGIIDRKILITGSTNWSEAGFGLNDESLIILHKLTKTQNQKLDKIWGDLLKSSQRYPQTGKDLHQNEEKKAA